MAVADSLNIVFDQVKGRLAVQDAQIAAIDGKANFGLASASLLTAGIAGLHTRVATAQSTGAIESLTIYSFTIQPVTLGNYLIVLALVAYTAVLITSYNAYKIRNFVVVPDPNRLLETYLDKPEVEVKSMLVEVLADAFYRNEALVKQKLFWTTGVLWSLMIEGFLLLAITLVQLTL